MVKFGPAGNCETFYAAGHKRTLEAPKWLYELGLTHYEYSFGKGILLNDDTASQIGEEFKKYSISVSVHAPYYINFACVSEEQAEKNHDYVLKSIHKLRLLGGNRLIVHPASLGKMTREEAVDLTKKRLERLSEILKENDCDDILICLETMGKQAQIGSVQEVLDFCKIADNYIPTFDFGHINSITQGSLKTKEDYMNILTLAIKELGIDKIKHCHMHFSKIEYGAKGEIKHLTLEDEMFGPEFEPLAEAIKELNLEPIIVCESHGVMAQDALKLKNIFNN